MRQGSQEGIEFLRRSIEALGSPSDWDDLEDAYSSAIDALIEFDRSSEAMQLAQEATARRPSSERLRELLQGLPERIALTKRR